ncbi:MAG TPA: DUF4296 domain-containing protein [Bacteroidales bacterium]|nr:DUF4296 domain-containing protein [Bacteroidales bacterium]HRZ75998.1 DUF4296 domain-containing protein [Bacteroidales bacterium]
MRPWLILVVFLLVLAACQPSGKERPENIIAPDRMSLVLAEVYITEAVLSNMMIPYDSLQQVREAWFSAVYRKHGIDRATFDSSYHYYETHPDLLEKIQDDAITEMMKREAEVE